MGRDDPLFETIKPPGNTQPPRPLQAKVITPKPDVCFTRDSPALPYSACSAHFEPPAKNPHQAICPHVNRLFARPERTRPAERPTVIHHHFDWFIRNESGWVSAYGECASTT